jgi:hypothetical protein
MRPRPMAGDSAVKRFSSPGLGSYLLRHPSDISTLARAGWRFRAGGWWRHAPFLPLPDAAYWRFRMTTYGADESLRLPPRVMVEAARWTLRQTVTR